MTGGLTASVGIGSSKFIAKVASDLDKPDGLVVVSPGTERDLLRPMHVSVIPGVGPATAERLRRAGIHTVADLETVSEDELVRLLGNAHGHGLYLLARAEDDRPVVAERETKSVSVEGTYDTDLTDRRLMEGLLTRQADNVAKRLRKHALSGRTITIKVRLHDFTTLSRSATLPSPTDHGATIARLARSLLADIDTSGGVRLLGVGVSGPRRLGAGGPVRRRPRSDAEPDADVPDLPDRAASAPGHRAWTSCTRRSGPAGSGAPAGAWSPCASRPRETPAGPVRSFAVDDPELGPAPIREATPAPAGPSTDVTST